MHSFIGPYLCGDVMKLFVIVADKIYVHLCVLICHFVINL
jgi:hypothetical protein